MLSGLALASAAGLNAYVPVLVLGLFVRYTSVVEVPGQWTWLGNGWFLLALLALLVLELITDKIPALDHLNDLVQTLVRPVAGGVVFAGAVQGAEGPPGAALTVVAFIAGLVIALVVHIVKAAGRAVVNRSAPGVGAPLLSGAEDCCAVVLTLVALLLPGLVVLFVAAAAAALAWVVRERRRGLLTTGDS
ncbi:MAG TPA: DUF4126 domain-containing protein [Beutenbergiaceae bacterium]|nr:DUF4126 domain-containing protein [Beutenbergiaceae bacterium]